MDRPSSSSSPLLASFAVTISSLKQSSTSLQTSSSFVACLVGVRCFAQARRCSLLCGTAKMQQFGVAKTTPIDVNASAIPEEDDKPSLKMLTGFWWTAYGIWTYEGVPPATNVTGSKLALSVLIFHGGKQPQDWAYYTFELEAEVQKLKEINKESEKKADMTRVI
ncbi:hypothetical protein PIB30_069413 [Stylosanthes scabra]|uniref:Uncharacterized protein n=1 Tax=Stylosanthes scabra TaxID=79078 RepID=A0ABU6YLB8_9FABA|nr:hypothetical protein [Stylosanthes scabra]